MKHIVRVMAVLFVCAFLLQAIPRKGDVVLPGHDFQMYCYNTKKEWRLSDFHKGNQVVLLITGSIC